MDAQKLNSTLALEELLFRLVSLHPLKEFDQIIQLNNEMHSVLEHHRHLFESSNQTRSASSFDEKYSSIFTAYTDSVILATYMYPLTSLMDRFLLGIEFMAAKGCWLNRK